MNGTKYILRLCKSLEIETDEPERPSFEAIARRTGRSFRNCAFIAIVAQVSVIPQEIFDKVFPVQGQTTRQSSLSVGPTGSASGIVWMISFLHISNIL